MPGFSLLYTPHRDVGELAARCESVLEKMRHDKSYVTKCVDRDSNLQLAWTAYSGYPIQSWTTDESALMVEGCVYSPDVAELLLLLGPDFRAPGGVQRAANFLRDWTQEADGDYAIVYISKRPPRGVILALDPLGRLPVYWKLSGGRLLASREVKFISALSESVELDTRGIAEALLFAFPLEERTFLQGISRLPPGAVLRWEPDDDPHVHISSHPWVFSTEGRAKAGMVQYTEELASEFIASCERRARVLADRPLVLSLSGGLDSRAVAAAFKHLGRPLQTRTFVDGTQQRNKDADRAAMIAAATGFDWKAIPLATPSLEAHERLVAMKGGLNSAAMAYAEEYLSAIKEGCGPTAVLLSGGGGDLALPPRHPYRVLSSNHDLAGLLLSRSAIFHTETVAQLMGTTTDVLRDRLTETLAGYPEEDLPGRYLHFCFMGFEFKNYFEGDDRNRCHLWSAAPFYGQPFFTRAMAAPFGWKRRRRLQVAFLRQLGVEIARIPSANTGLVPGSVLDQARQWMREASLSSPAMEIIWRAQRRRRTPHAFVAPALVNQMMIDTATKSAAVGAVFDRTLMQEILRAPLSEQQYWLLYTLVRYVSSLDTPSQTATS